jgi:hypothetical protein
MSKLFLDYPSYLVDILIYELKAAQTLNEGANESIRQLRSWIPLYATAHKHWA